MLPSQLATNRYFILAKLIFSLDYISAAILVNTFIQARSGMKFIRDFANKWLGVPPVREAKICTLYYCSFLCSS